MQRFDLQKRRGLCLSHELWRDAAADADLGWVQIHPETVLRLPRLQIELDALAAVKPVSLNCTSLCFGSPDGINGSYVRELRTLCERIQPISVSGHLAWSSLGSLHFSELLPLPLNRVSLARVCRTVDAIQAALRRQVLIENPARLQALREDSYSEIEFIAEVVQATGCGVLLNISNLWSSAHNLDAPEGQSAQEMLESLPLHAVREMRVAAWRELSLVRDDGAVRTLLVVTHDRPIPPAAWCLSREWVAQAGTCRVAIEWQQAVPDYLALKEQLEEIDEPALQPIKHGVMGPIPLAPGQFGQLAAPL